jgi:glyoxylase-like metal-dependent hydrolase (beta-lactamase superfamily II)
MKTTQITPNAYQLTRYGFVNSFLIREHDGFTLIDTGLSRGADDIVSAARTLGAPIRRIVLTHAHVDHVGSVDALIELLAPATGPANPPLEFAASARSLPLLQQPPNLATLPGEPTGKIKGGLPGIKSIPTHHLAEGDVYGSLLTIETPGHIPGHLSFLDQRDGTLFSGDALICMGYLTVSGFCPWFFPLPNGGTWDKGLAIKSAEKLLGFPIQRFASGHGALKEGGLDALREAIAKAKS